MLQGKYTLDKSPLKNPCSKAMPVKTDFLTQPILLMTVSLELALTVLASPP